MKKIIGCLFFLFFLPIFAGNGIQTAHFHVINGNPAEIILSYQKEYIESERVLTAGRLELIYWLVGRWFEKKAQPIYAHYFCDKPEKIQLYFLTEERYLANFPNAPINGYTFQSPNRGTMVKIRDDNIAAIIVHIAVYKAFPKLTTQENFIIGRGYTQKILYDFEHHPEIWKSLN